MPAIAPSAELPSRRLRLRMLKGTYAIGRLAPDAPWPDWLPAQGFLSITRTPDELSIIAPDEAVPDLPGVVRGYIGFVVEGPLPFDAVGILASLASPLAAAGIPILAVSTYDTDYLFLPEGRRAEAADALRAAGHEVADDPRSGVSTHSSANNP